MEELNDYKEEQESTFDLKAELYKYLGFWKWLLFGLFIGGLIAALYNRYTIPMFRTEASMMILKDNQNAIAGALPSGGGSILTFGQNTLDNQIVSLKSKRLVEKVVRSLNHNISYYIEGNVITTEAYKSSPVIIKFISPDSLVEKQTEIFFVNPISENKFQITSENGSLNKEYNLEEFITYKNLEFSIIPRNSFSRKKFKSFKTIKIIISPVSLVAEEYIDELQIGPKGRALDILSLSIIQAETERSQDFINNLMLQFNSDGVSDKSQVARNTTEFIHNRLELITQELDSVEGGMATFKKANQIMDVASSAQLYSTKSSEAEQQIFDLETQKIIINSIKDLLNSRNKYQLLPTNLGVQDGGIVSLISPYNSLVLERNRLLTTGTQENPLVINLNNQLDELKSSLFDNIETYFFSTNLRLQELQQYDNTAQNKFSTFPGMEKGMRGIERQQQIKEQLYLFLLQKREEAAIAFAVTPPVAKIIDPAYTNSEPVDPKPWLILVSGLLIGLILPIIILFVKFMLDTKVHHKGDLTPLIKNIPFLGEVPKIGENQNEIIQLNDRSPLAESFRILRTNLAYLLKPKPDNKGEIIYVTSTIKGEGKTFISYNLARTLSTTNKKVVIIGADIRNPKLHRYIDFPMESKGLSDYLYNYDLVTKDIINDSLDSNVKVDIILSGSIPPNPAELFMSNRMGILLDDLSKNYDFVIVDTAPTMIVTDTLLISPLADTTLYITRAGYTEKKLLDFPKELKQQGKLKGLAVILNDVDYSKFSYGSKYGYNYGYGYGYGTDEETRWKRIKKKVSKK